MKTEFSVRNSIGILAILVLTSAALSGNQSAVDAQNPPPPQAGQPSEQPPPPLTAANMKGKTAGEFYKNVKVLKDIPAADIHPSMEYITIALGVPCAYCHDARHFDNDDKREKKTARSMMRMMFSLDDVVFHGKREITCYMCHRGAAKGAATLVFPGEKAPTEPTAAELFPPVVVPGIVLDSGMAPEPVVPGPPAAPKPGEVKAPPPAPLPAADDVFSKYTQALGGAAAIRQASTLVEKGTVEMLIPAAPPAPGIPASPPSLGNPPAELYRKSPNKAVEVVQLPRGPSLQGYDGNIGWLTSPVTREETGGELALLQDWAEFTPALNFKEGHSRVQVDAIERIGARDAYRVVGLRANGSGIDRLYFDAQTGLLLRSWTTMDSALGSFPEETNYEDYREVSGLKVPFTIRLVSPEGNRTYKWDQVEVNIPIEDTRFAKTLPKTPAGPGEPGAPPPPTPGANR
jgi:photosynthetic reaction center cytochrome c subunit